MNPYKLFSALLILLISSTPMTPVALSASGNAQEQSAQSDDNLPDPPVTPPVKKSTPGGAFR